MTIYSNEMKDGKPVILLEVPVTDGAILHKSVNGECYIQLSFVLPQRIGLCKGCYVKWPEEGAGPGQYKFEVMSNVYPECQAAEGGWKYTAKFESQASHMKHYNIFYIRQDYEEVSFSDTTTLAAFGQVAADSMNRANLGKSWSVRTSFPAGHAFNQDIRKPLSFRGEKVWDAVGMIAQAFEVEWWTEENGDQVTICFGKLEAGTAQVIREGEIVSNLPARKGDDAGYGTRFYIFGSTRNLTGYDNKPRPGEASNHVNEERLRLPAGLPGYIDARPGLRQEEIVEQVGFFDEIYPTSIETVSKVLDAKYGDTKISTYNLICSMTAFRPSDMTAEKMQAVFISGPLEGQTYDVEVDKSYDPGTFDPAKDHFDKTFTIVPVEETFGSKKVVRPNKDMCPGEGNQFVLTGIKLSKKHFRDAEDRLEREARSWVAEKSADTDLYTCQTNPVYCAEHGIDFELGQAVRLEDPVRFGPEGRLSRIQEFEKDLCNPYKATYTVGDNTAYSRLGSLESAVSKGRYEAQSVTAASGAGGRGVYLIRSKYDLTIPADYNAFSAAATEARFLNKQTGGVVEADVRLTKDMAVGGDLISEEFRQDGFTGTGFGLYKDGDGARVLEIDRVCVRRSLDVNEIIINQVSHNGGVQAYSAAGIEAVRVEETPGAYRCWFDTRNGQVTNQFVANDQAYCTRFGADGVQRVKHYWRLVVAAGPDWIDLSKTDAALGSGVPAEGDSIVQLGNRVDAGRRSMIEMKSTEGGSIVLYAGIDGYNLVGKEQVGLRYDTTDREAKFFSYGDAFIGDRDLSDPAANYLTFQKRSGESRKKLYVNGVVSIGQGSAGLKNLGEWAEAQTKIDNAAQAAQSANAIISAVQTDVESLRNQLDGQVECWFYNGLPTSANKPAADWTDDYKKKLHVGDTYTDLLTGRAWRWVLKGSVYAWEELDAAAAHALESAKKSEAALDGRCAVFLRTPVAADKYDVGDLWMNATFAQKYNNDLLRAKTAKLAGVPFNIDHWEPATKYTDDTVANEAKSRLDAIAADDKLSSEEKPAVRQQWAQIGKEHTLRMADAANYGVETTALVTAYNALSAYMTAVAITVSCDTQINADEFSRKFANYAAEAARFSDAVADKLAQGKVDQLAPSEVNLLLDSAKGWKNSSYPTAVIALGGYKPREGEECTVVMKCRTGAGKINWSLFNSGGVEALMAIPVSKVDENGYLVATFKWRIGASLNTHLNIFATPSAIGTESEIEWVKLVAGNRTSKSWTPSNEDVQAGIGAAKEAVTGLNTYVDGAFKNGIIDQSEAIAIGKYKNTVNETKLSVNKSVEALDANPWLTGTAKTNLATAKQAFDTAVDNLLQAIGAAVADGKTTEAEKNDVDAKYAVLANALASLNTRIGEAGKAIQDAVKAGAVTDITKDTQRYVGRFVANNTAGMFCFQTAIPEKSAKMLVLDLKGYMYGERGDFDVSVVFYTYNQGLASYGYTVKGIDCVDRVRLGVKNGKVAIELKCKCDIYYPGFNATLRATLGTVTAAETEGWQLLNRALAEGDYLDGTYTNIVTVPRKDTAAEAKATSVQADVNVLRQETKASVGELSKAISEINADDVFDVSEKQSMRTIWENINGVSGMEHPDTVTAGSYARVLAAAAAAGEIPGPQTRTAFAAAGNEPFMVKI